MLLVPHRSSVAVRFVPGDLLHVASLILNAILAPLVGVIVFRRASRAWRARATRRMLRIPSIAVTDVHPVFRPGRFGPGPETEVRFIGRGLLEVPGGTSDVEAWILAVLARDAHCLFEFGTGSGKTAYLWARNAPPGATIATLALPPGRLGDYVQEPEDSQVASEIARVESRFEGFFYSPTEAAGRIQQVLLDSKDFDETPFLDRCDLVFVDGSHASSYVRSDSGKALRMVRPGGLVLWHDYNDVEGTRDVVWVLNEIAERHPLGRIEGTSLVAHRRPPCGGDA